MKLLLTLLLFTFNCFAQFGFNTINSSTYLTERYLDNINGVYGWQKFDSSYENTNTISSWIGGNDLTVYSPSGNLNATTDRLGRQNALSLNGTDQCLYDASTDHDNANESFTAWTWFRTDNWETGSFGRIMGKDYFGNSNEVRSWSVYKDTGDDIKYIVFYTDTKDFIEVNDLVDPSYYNDNKPHFVAVTYNQSETSMTLFRDGTVVDYKINSNLSVRNNSADSKLAYGCNYSTANGTQDFFDADISDYGFTHHAMTTNELRKIYLAGARRYGYIDGNDVVQIPGVKKGYEIGDVQYELTVTGTNWTTVGAVGVPYKIGEVWRLKFNIVGQVSSAVSELELTIDGILIKGGSGRYQALACWEWNSTVELTQRCTASPGTNKIKINLDSTGSYFTFAGDIELDQKPSFITELD